MENKTEEQEQTFTLEQMKECWRDAQYEMHKTFSSSYVAITFDKWLEEKQEQINRLVS